MFFRSNKCVIEEKRFKGPLVNDANRHAYHTEERGRPVQYRGLRYIHKKSGDEYLTLAGGFAFPDELPGFAVVLGVKKGRKGVVYHCLEESEKESPQKLLSEAHRLFRKWGKNCEVIPFFFYTGLYNDLHTFVHRFNARIRDRRDELKVLPTIAVEKPESFTVLVHNIGNLLARDNKRLVLHKCDKLRHALQRLDKKTQAKGKIKEFPAVSALGFAVMYLELARPWQTHTTPDYVYDSRFDENFREHRDWCKLFGLPCDDPGPYDDGDLTPTIPY